MQVSDHPIVHVEFASKEPSEASRFYADLFGWQTMAMPVEGYGDYYGFRAEGGVGGGFPKVDGHGTNAGDVVVYVGTNDINASLAKATALGATTLMPEMEVGGMGWMAIFQDPTGNKVGLWKERQA